MATGPSFPNEILEDIVNFVGTTLPEPAVGTSREPHPVREALKSLALASRIFRHLAQSYLYKSICVSGFGGWGFGSRRMNAQKRTRDVVASLKMHPELLGYVRTFTFFIDDTFDCYPEFFIRDVLPFLLGNLRRVESFALFATLPGRKWTTFDLDTQRIFVRFLEENVALRDVNLRGFNLPETLLNHLPPSVEVLTLSSCGVDDGPSDLISVTGDCVCVPGKIINVPSSCPLLLSQRHFSKLTFCNLESLRVRGDIGGHLGAYLEVAPDTLKHLCINFLVADLGITYEELAPYGRPLTNICISHLQHLEIAFDTLSQYATSTTSTADLLFYLVSGPQFSSTHTLTLKFTFRFFSQWPYNGITRDNVKDLVMGTVNSDNFERFDELDAFLSRRDVLKRLETVRVDVHLLLPSHVPFKVDAATLENVKEVMETLFSGTDLRMNLKVDVLTVVRSE